MYEPSCSSCLGLHVVCEETSSHVMRPYAHSSFELRENTIATWGPEYKLSVDIKQIYKNPIGFILHFYTTTHNGPSGACGSTGGGNTGHIHVPNIHWLDGSLSKLRFGYCVNNVASTFDYVIDRMEWTAIEIGQRLVGESSYEFYIKIRLGFGNVNIFSNFSENFQNFTPIFENKDKAKTKF